MKQRLFQWLGINHATLAVLIAIGGMGLSEEIWKNFLAIHLNIKINNLSETALTMGILAFFTNLLEGVAYLLGGAFAHRLGARLTLLISGIPIAFGFILMLSAQKPWHYVIGALLISHWEPLSVPATFDVVGEEVPHTHRTIAFSVQSIFKRLPKVLGPLIGMLVFLLGYWANLALAFGVLATSLAIQFYLTRKMKPKSPQTNALDLKYFLKVIPPDLRHLLQAEIMIRWGDWFIRDFASLYVVFHLGWPAQKWGVWPALTSFTALITYLPMGKWVDRAPSPKPFIGLTFLLFALFPILLVLLPKSGLSLPIALSVIFIMNGLRELGEPARKAMITAGFPREIRSRAIGWYWGLRSFAFCIAPIVSVLLWNKIGPDLTFLLGGGLGLLGTFWYWIRVGRK